MRRVLMVSLALGASAFVTPGAAQATAPDVIDGGCAFVGDLTPNVTGGEQVAVIYDASATRTGGIPFAPIGATVTCWMDVNGVEAPGTRFSYSGTGVQAGADPISFVAAAGDIVVECESVAFADGTTKAPDCPSEIPPAQLPPQPVIDLLDAAFEYVIDPAVCPVLVANAGPYGPVTIDSGGDVYAPDPFGLGLNPIYNCPPYA